MRCVARISAFLVGPLRHSFSSCAYGTTHDCVFVWLIEVMTVIRVYLLKQNTFCSMSRRSNGGVELLIKYVGVSYTGTLPYRRLVLLSPKRLETGVILRIMRANCLHATAFRDVLRFQSDPGNHNYVFSFHCVWEPCQSSFIDYIVFLVQTSAWCP